VVEGYDIRVMRRKFGSKRNNVMGEWRELLNGKFREFYFSRNIVGVPKSWRTRQAGHVTRMGRTEMHAMYWLINPKERKHMEDIKIGK
jgi:hypothetical protein